MTVSAYRNQLPRLWTRTFSISGPDLYNSASGVKRAAQVEIIFGHKKHLLIFLHVVGQARPSLVDSYNRRHDYLRISLTERCNLRCFYCMPEEGVQLSPNEKILTDEEILRLAKLFVQSGVTKIRLTGGEPTVRKGVVGIVAGLNELRSYGLRSIAMTSNGLALHRRLPELVENGLTHLNLSLDTLDPFKFEFMTKRSGLEAVLKTLKVALESPHLQKVKLNVVVVKGLNDNEVLDFVEMTKDRPISVRFIEFMPFTGNKWDKFKMVPSSDLLRVISAKHLGLERMADETNVTARSWKIPGYQGEFGFISSMSDHFCSACNRLRITADGQIKVCLFDAKEVSLRDEIRTGASDFEILRLIGRAVHGKEEKHLQMEDIDVVSNRPMILIGRASMVDVSEKSVTKRSATAKGRIVVTERAYDLINKSYSSESESIMGKNSSSMDEAQKKVLRKGDTLTVAQLAAIMGSKKTSDLIPLCHPLPLTDVKVKLTCEAFEETQGIWKYSVVCRATVACEGKTGVEMEALTAVSVGLLTIWDMLKAVAGKEMVIGEIMVSEKSGGRSGEFHRP
ncbi:molybdenum cofactor biosynthesis prote [Lentinula edodes]|nr:molybdenum cofactor biosynthesis prote [Lentinula edodes]